MQFLVKEHCVLAAARMCVLPEGHANESHIPIVVQHSLSKHRMEWQTVVAASGTKILPACSHPAYVLHFGAVATKRRSTTNVKRAICDEDYVTLNCHIFIPC